MASQSECKHCANSIKNRNHKCMKHASCAVNKRWDPSKCSDCIHLFGLADQDDKEAQGKLKEIAQKIKTSAKNIVSSVFVNEPIEQKWHRDFLMNATHVKTPAMLASTSSDSSRASFSVPPASSIITPPARPESSVHNASPSISIGDGGVLDEVLNQLDQLSAHNRTSQWAASANASIEAQPSFPGNISDFSQPRGSSAAASFSFPFQAEPLLSPLQESYPWLLDITSPSAYKLPAEAKIEDENLTHPLLGILDHHTVFVGIKKGIKFAIFKSLPMNIWKAIQSWERLTMDSFSDTQWNKVNIMSGVTDALFFAQGVLHLKDFSIKQDSPGGASWQVKSLPPGIMPEYRKLLAEKFQEERVSIPNLQSLKLSSTDAAENEVLEFLQAGALESKGNCFEESRSDTTYKLSPKDVDSDLNVRARSATHLKHFVCLHTMTQMVQAAEESGNAKDTLSTLGIMAASLKETLKPLIAKDVKDMARTRLALRSAATDKVSPRDLKDILRSGPIASTSLFCPDSKQKAIEANQRNAPRGRLNSSGPMLYNRPNFKRPYNPPPASFKRQKTSHPDNKVTRGKQSFRPPTKSIDPPSTSHPRSSFRPVRNNFFKPKLSESRRDRK